MLLLSPRNSEEASRHVLGATSSNKFVYTPERSRQVEEIKTVSPSLQAWEIPSLWDVLHLNNAKPLPVKGPGSDTEDRVAVYIHSSGTTG